MAFKRDSSFFDAVCAAAKKDNRPITEVVMRRIQRRGIPLVFFHDANGVPVVFEAEGSHGELKRSLRQLEDGSFIAEKSVGATSYVGASAAVYLSCLGLITAEQDKAIRGEART